MKLSDIKPSLKENARLLIELWNVSNIDTVEKYKDAIFDVKPDAYTWSNTGIILKAI